MIASTNFVSNLLATISSSDQRDSDALRHIVRRVIDGPDHPWFQAETPERTLYVMTKSNVAKFLQLSGLEEWYGSTFLSISAGGKVVSDVHGDTRFARTNEALEWLAGATMLQMEALGTKPTSIDGQQCFALRESALVSVLGIARASARSSSVWQAGVAPDSAPVSTPSPPSCATPVVARKRSRP